MLTLLANRPWQQPAYIEHLTCRNQQVDLEDSLRPGVAIKVDSCQLKQLVNGVPANAVCRIVTDMSDKTPSPTCNGPTHIRFTEAD